MAGISAKNSKVKIVRSRISGADEGVSSESSDIDIVDSKIESKKNNSDNKRNWWIIIGSIAAVIMVLLTFYGLFVVNYSDNPPEVKETSVETEDMRVETEGSVGIRVVGSTNVTSTNNTIIGFDTGIEVINSRNVSSTDDTIIGP